MRALIQTARIIRRNELELKARRSNGDGSIDKIFRKRKDGSAIEIWRGRITADGRRVTVYASTKSELVTKLTKLRFDASRGAVLKGTHESVGAFLTRWLEDAARPSIRASTHAQYKFIIEKHVTTKIGALRIEKLAPADVQAMLSAMEREGKSPRLRELSFVILKSALSQAERWGIVYRNVADAVEKPRVPRKSMSVLTPEQADRFLREAESSPFYALYVLALTTGMRQGELVGLQWRDVDLDGGSLSVNRAITTVANRQVLTEPKTSRGRRRIDLPSMAVTALRVHQRAIFARGMRACEWVFPNATGEPIDAHNLVKRSFRPLLAKAIAAAADEARKIGVEPQPFPAIRFHDLRHTAATLMMMRGVQPKVVQERLGHASIAITLDTYSHVLPTMQRGAADEMDSLFEGLRTARQS